MPIDRLSAKIRVKAGRPMVNFILRMLPAMGIVLSLSRVKVVITFLGHCWTLQQRAGMRMLVIYLKAAYVVMQQSLGGQRLDDMSPLGTRFARTKGAGLPKVIPALDRKLITGGNTSLAKFWLSLFSVYRILVIPGKIKLSSITDPSSMKPAVLTAWKDFVPVFTSMKMPKLPGWDKTEWSRALDSPGEYLKELRAVPFLISKSTPAARSGDPDIPGPLSTSPSAVLWAAHVWAGLPRAYAKLTAWCRLTGNTGLLNRIDSFSKFPASLLSGSTRIGTLGRLGFKEEAAGKVRVFAMVDPFTQWLFKPLWDHLLQVLECIPQDGTRNQIRPLDRLLRRYPKGPYYSFDLSAATDRMPVTLQTALLTPFIGESAAAIWESLLIDRGYVAMAPKYKIYGEELFYNAGQPMGALTSWGMLALTHHALVQWAAQRSAVVASSNFVWFDAYALLGDDIVIADAAVAQEYLRVCQEIGVEIGLAKSLVSPRGLAVEFAKRTIWRGVDISPVPFTEMWVASQLISAGVEIARKYNFSPARWLALHGAGYRVLGSLQSPFLNQGRNWRNLLLAYISPGGVKPRTWLEFFSSKSMISRWGTPSVRLAILNSALLKRELQSILTSLDKKEVMWATIRELVQVKRDREYYGTTPYTSKTGMVFADINVESPTPCVYVSPGVYKHQSVLDTKCQVVLEDLKNLLYRTAYLDVLCEVRDVRNLINDLLEGVSPAPDSLDEVAAKLDSLNKNLAALPLPKEMYKRKLEECVRLHEHRQVLMWYVYSSYLRRNIKKTQKRSGGNPD